MIDLLMLQRYNRLINKYNNLKAEAKVLLKKGLLTDYLNKLGEVQKVRVQLVNTASANY